MSSEKERSLQSEDSLALEPKLAAYLASAAAIGTAMASEAKAAIVANTTPQAITINGEVNIDFDGDGVPEFQIDHDRYDLNGTDIDYLQIDKNGVNSAANPLPINASAAFSSTSNAYHPPFSDDYDGNHNGSWDAGDLAAWRSQYGMTGLPDTFTADGNEDGDVDGADFFIWQRATGVTFSYDQSYQSDGSGFYPLALTSGNSIGPADFYDFSETSDAFGLGTYLRANRLIDEDLDANGKSLIDASLLGDPQQVEPHPDAPLDPNDPGGQFVGLDPSDTRYLGVHFDLHDEGYANNLPLINGPNVVDDPNNYWYGWIGIQITNEADATGMVTGWAYEDQIGTSISAGDTGLPLSASTAIPEPTSVIMAAVGGITLASGVFGRRIFRGNRKA